MGRVNLTIYKDSRYALCHHSQPLGFVQGERGLLTLAGKDIRNKEDILTLLEAVWYSGTVEGLRCQGHQKGSSEEAKGNQAADVAVKEAALEASGALGSSCGHPRPCPPILALLHLGGRKIGPKTAGPEGWLLLPATRPIVLRPLDESSQIRCTALPTWEKQKLTELVRGKYFMPNLDSLVDGGISKCVACA